MAYSATAHQVTHALQRFYRRVGGKVVTATGGSTTTIIDTKLAEELADSNEDDLYNGGTAIVIYDAGGSGAAPEGEMSRISDYVASTLTVTTNSTLTAAVASSDKVLLVGSDFPLNDVIEQLNDALKSMGEIPYVDTSLSTIADTTEYALPVALKGGRILRIEIADDTDNETFSPLPNYDIIPSAPGSTGLLKIAQYSAGLELRIHYLTVHPRVNVYSDYISEYLHPDLVHALLFAQCMQWKNDADRISGNSANPESMALEQKAWSQVDRAKMMYPIVLPPKQPQPFPAWSM